MLSTNSCWQLAASTSSKRWRAERKRIVLGCAKSSTTLGLVTCLSSPGSTLAVIAERGAGFRSLADTWADTTTPHGRLMLTVLGGLAEFERELIRSRTSEGRERAKARGVKLGRKPS